VAPFRIGSNTFSTMSGHQFSGFSQPEKSSVWMTSAFSFSENNSASVDLPEPPWPSIAMKVVLPTFGLIESSSDKIFFIG